MARPNNTVPNSTLLDLKTSTAPPPRIQIEDDELILDQLFCAEVLAGATRRAAGRLDHQGLPFVHVNARQWHLTSRGLR
jgi:hypothetical protein